MRSTSIEDGGSGARSGSGDPASGGGDTSFKSGWRRFDIEATWGKVTRHETILTKRDMKVGIRIMGIDPAFSSGGDRTMAVIGELGWDSKQLVQVLNIVGIEELTMNANQRQLIKMVIHRMTQHTHEDAAARSSQDWQDAHERFASQLQKLEAGLIDALDEVNPRGISK